MMDILRYPIGEFEPVQDVTADQLQAWIKDIADAPSKLRQAIEGLSPEQLDVPYRPGGWTVRQVVHHLVDAHMIAFTRFKFALTESNPLLSLL